ncbi:glycosyltransferase [Sphingobium sp. JS3065]|uniref:glycosyltransferase family 2 protein n=1 Tax=Sphingobium sp. JS3065 TaxID=2970925 RepID=UPI00226561BF|nr:glycosyltransferase [Sphingobium sp. JS3065]UZW55347.1 glycosyltransferase [Sphingobium sp. JS3065]
MTAPLVSVLIPTFNRAHYVGDAIASALGQTVTDIEVIVVDDGSTDTTTSLLDSISDPRMRVIRHERNMGIPATRNTALAAAEGVYIAWLDSDDIARPTRLAEQVDFLELYPDIAMVGSCAGKLRPDGSRKKGVRIPPFTPDLISSWLLFRSAFQQSSILGRAAILKNYQYDLDFPVCEDVDMFLRLQENHRLANLPRVLIDRRIHPEQSVRERGAEIADRKMMLARPMLERLGVSVTKQNLERHGLLGKVNLRGEQLPDDFLNWTKSWLHELQDANKSARIYDQSALALACDFFWTLACRGSASSIGVPAATGAFVGRRPRSLFNSTSYGWFRDALPLLVRG